MDKLFLSFHPRTLEFGAGLFLNAPADSCLDLSSQYCNEQGVGLTVVGVARVRLGGYLFRVSVKGRPTADAGRVR